MTEAPAQTEFEQATIEDIAGFGLPGMDKRHQVHVGESDWLGLLSSIVNQRITGLAVAAVADGHLSLADDQFADLLESHRTATVHTLAVERIMVSLVPAMEEAGIEVVVLKGPAVSRTAYPDPSWRNFGDLDLLVRTRDWRAACAVLREHGFDRTMPEPRPGFDERFGKAATHEDARGFQIDLHRTLTVGAFGLWLDPDEVFHHTAGFEAGGRIFRRLNDTGLFLHACMHAVLGYSPPLLSPIRDVAQLAWSPKVDWDLASVLAERWHLRAAVAHALREAMRILAVPLPAPARAAMDVSVTRRERKALEACATEARWRGGTARSNLRAIKGLRNKAAYVRMLLFPGREFLEARAGGEKHPSYFRRWLVPFRWLRQR